jgi:hypothetical protein
MPAIVVKDELIKKARSVTAYEKDEDIVQAALEEYIIGMENMAEARHMFGKLNSWDPEFAGLTEKWENRR